MCVMPPLFLHLAPVAASALHEMRSVVLPAAGAPPESLTRNSQFRSGMRPGEVP